MLHHSSDISFQVLWRHNIEAFYSVWQCHSFFSSYCRNCGLFFAFGAKIYSLLRPNISPLPSFRDQESTCQPEFGIHRYQLQILHPQRAALMLPSINVFTPVPSSSPTDPLITLSASLGIYCGSLSQVHAKHAGLHLRKKIQLSKKL